MKDLIARDGDIFVMLVLFSLKAYGGDNELINSCCLWEVMSQLNRRCSCVYVFSFIWYCV